MTRVVALGAGLGGVPMAIELHEQPGAGHRVTAIADTESFQFTPSNPWVAAG